MKFLYDVDLDDRLLRGEDDLNWLSLEVDHACAFVNSIVTHLDCFTLSLGFACDGEYSVTSLDGRGNNLDEVNCGPVSRNLKPLVGIHEDFLDFGVGGDNLLNLVGLNNSGTVLSFNLSDVVGSDGWLDGSNGDNLRLLGLGIDDNDDLLLGLFSGHDDSVLGDSAADGLDFGGFRHNSAPGGVVVLDDGDNISEDGVGLDENRNGHLGNGYNRKNHWLDGSVVCFCCLGSCGGGLDSFRGDDLNILRFFFVNDSGADSIFGPGTSKHNSHSFCRSVIDLNNRVNLP